MEFLIFWRHTASFKFSFSKVQDFGNYELSHMNIQSNVLNTYRSRKAKFLEYKIVCFPYLSDKCFGCLKEPSH